jgi:hypothetical protein
VHAAILVTNPYLLRSGPKIKLSSVIDGSPIVGGVQYLGANIRRRLRQGIGLYFISLARTLNQAILATLTPSAVETGHAVNNDLLQMLLQMQPYSLTGSGHGGGLGE